MAETKKREKEKIEKDEEKKKLRESITKKLTDAEKRFLGL